MIGQARFRNLFLSTLLSFAAFDLAADVCWAPPVEAEETPDGVPSRAPELARLHATLDAAEAVLRETRAIRLMSGVRLRSRRWIGRPTAAAGGARPAGVIIEAFPPETFGSGCTLVEGDSLPRAAWFEIRVNDPKAIVDLDSSLEANGVPVYFEPAQTGKTAGGLPVYNHGQILLQGRELLWLPVTNAEMLDSMIQNTRAKRDETAARGDSADALDLDEEAAQAEVEEARTKDPEAAAKLSELMEQMRRGTEEMKKVAAAPKAAEDPLDASLAGLEDLRRRLGAAGLKRQARYGTGDYGLAVDEKGGRPLIKLNPRYFAGGEDGRIRLVVVSAAAARKDAEPAVAAALSSFDYSALLALLSK